MKRSVQEIVELLVFGLIALLVGTGLLWLVGWVFDITGGIFRFFAGLIWGLLRFIVPVALVAAIAYLLVRLLQGRNRAEAGDKAPPGGPSATAPQPSQQAAPSAAEETVVDTTVSDQPPPGTPTPSSGSVLKPEDTAVGGDISDHNLSPADPAPEASEVRIEEAEEGRSVDGEDYSEIDTPVDTGEDDVRGTVGEDDERDRDV